MTFVSKEIQLNPGGLHFRLEQDGTVSIFYPFEFFVESLSEAQRVQLAHWLLFSMDGSGTVPPADYSVEGADGDPDQGTPATFLYRINPEW